VPLGCFTADDVVACSCLRTGPVCQAAWGADVVFAGTVHSIDQVDQTDAQGHQYPVQLVRLDIDQPFINAAARRMEALESAEHVRLSPFQSWRKVPRLRDESDTPRFRVIVCSRTRPLSEAAEDLRYLTSLSTAGAGARVLGRVNEWARDPAEEQGVDFLRKHHDTVVSGVVKLKTGWPAACALLVFGSWAVGTEGAGLSAPE
jgi:hypothetical protein